LSYFEDAVTVLCGISRGCIELVVLEVNQGLDHFGVEAKYELGLARKEERRGGGEPGGADVLRVRLTLHLSLTTLHTS